MKRAALFLGLLFVAAFACSVSGFELREQRERLPEQGEIVRTIIVHEDREFSFVRPNEWKISLDPAERKATLRSRDYGATLVLQIQPEISALRAPVNLSALRQRVRERFRGAAVREEFTCYANDLQGPAFELQEQNAQGVTICYRVAFVPFAGGCVEFTLTAAASQAASARADFGVFLTSFNIESVSARAARTN
jgi:hypothetical protein